MPNYRYQPVIPKNGVAPHVLNPNRISGCDKQKEISLDDQHDNAISVVADLWDGDISKATFHKISTKGKGEDLTRPELEETERLLKTGDFDLMVLDDIGRLVRGADVVRIIGIAVDYGTRVVAPNDCIDTIYETWEEDVIAACRDHVGHNAHGPVHIEVKHLEILPPEDFDELNFLLEKKNKKLGRKPNAKGVDPLKGVQRKRTKFPGQHARCWYCGRQLIWGGNGIKENLHCGGARNWNCWNSVTLTSSCLGRGRKSHSFKANRWPTSKPLKRWGGFMG